MKTAALAQTLSGRNVLMDGQGKAVGGLGQGRDTSQMKVPIRARRGHKPS